MKRATTPAIELFIESRFVLVDNIGPFIPNTEIDRLMEELMKEFDGIYCGAMPDKAGIKLFSVRSTSGNDARNGENPHEYRLFCPSILLLILD